METNRGSADVSVAEDAAALASVKDSRRRVRRSGYPVWFWLVTGVAFGGFPFYVGSPSGVDPWLPDPVRPLVALASVLAVLGAGFALDRVRPIREGTSARSGWQVVLFLWRILPPIAVLILGGITWHEGVWQAPVAPLTTAAAAYLVWVGVGVASTSRPAHQWAPPPGTRPSRTGRAGSTP